ncbi:hypothetical protein H072_1237 [Dactylellina haptotyla CBS 200.50]|uniref:Uncharacterized protein n=1 Tax=Dactylellina haptotyla (strain CBS 200.50) TaxID=1284197 RepID=S8API7_DACHA|nr:hypothetical protein H072_1237 [Dactylellina haptotyla CBS 200.50]
MASNDLTKPESGRALGIAHPSSHLGTNSEQSGILTATPSVPNNKPGARLVFHGQRPFAPISPSIIGEIKQLEGPRVSPDDMENDSSSDVQVDGSENMEKFSGQLQSVKLASVDGGSSSEVEQTWTHNIELGRDLQTQNFPIRAVQKLWKIPIESCRLLQRELNCKQLIGEVATQRRDRFYQATIRVHRFALNPRWKVQRSFGKSRLEAINKAAMIWLRRLPEQFP